MKARSLITLLTAAVLAALLLTGCGTTLTEGRDGVIDKKNDRTYQHASVAYKPVEMGKEYGKLNIGESFSLDLYTIEGLSPEEWLATEEGDILYAEGVHLPTLTEMEPQAVIVCTEDTTVHVLRRISDAGIVTELAEAVVSGTEIVSITSVSQTPSVFYTLRFESKVYDRFYYTVTYVEYEEPIVIDGVDMGRYFLYDGFDRLFVPVSDALRTAMGLST